MELTLHLAQDDLEELVGKIATVLGEEIGEPNTGMSQWLDVAAAATYLCTSEQAIRAAIKRGQLPGKRPNGRVLFTREELDRYVTHGQA